MDTTIAISLTSTFLKFVGETLAELKRQELASIDLDLLRLKRTQLSEKLEDFKSDLAKAVLNEKAKKGQDLISRGLANSSIQQSDYRGIEQDANTELDRASREYNRAIEEIALLERKVIEHNRPWWRKLFCRK